MDLNFIRNEGTEFSSEPYESRLSSRQAPPKLRWEVAWLPSRTSIVPIEEAGWVRRLVSGRQQKAKENVKENPACGMMVGGGKKGRARCDKA